MNDEFTTALNAVRDYRSKLYMYQLQAEMVKDTNWHAYRDYLDNIAAVKCTLARAENRLASAVLLLDCGYQLAMLPKKAVQR